MNYKETLMYKEICETPAVLSALKEKNFSVMTEFIADIRRRNIKNITGAARGTSSHALTYFKYLAEIYAKTTVSIASCSVVTVYEGNMDLGGQLVIGVSQSGKAADVLEVLKRAKAQGALTLALTNDTESPLAKEAEFHLFCACGEEKSVAATKTFSAQCYLLAWLAAEIACNGNLLTALDGVGGALVGKLSSIELSAEALANCMQSVDDGFILSRGITYPLALEAALKLQETSYIKMKAYAFSDFQHGPMAMVNKGTPIIFLAPDAPYLDDLQTVASKMRDLGGEVYIVSNSPHFDGASNVFKVSSEGGEAVAVFGFALFLQLLACRVACNRGNNPDTPRALNKVTITK